MPIRANDFLASVSEQLFLCGFNFGSTLQVKKRSTNVGDNVYPTVEGRESEEWMVVDCGK